MLIFDWSVDYRIVIIVIIVLYYYMFLIVVLYFGYKLSLLRASFLINYHVSHYIIIV